MADLKKLLAVIESEEQNAIGGLNDELTTERAQAIDYYMGRYFGNEVEGRSAVVSRDVSDTIEWVKPSLIRIFAGGDETVQFDPTGPEDVEGAQQESDYVNHIIRQKNPWLPICYEWITDALLTRNAYAMAYHEERTETSNESYTGVTDDQMAMLLQDESVEVVQHSMYPMPGMQPVVDPMSGQVLQMPPSLHDVAVRKVKPVGKVCITVLAPERVLVSAQTKGMSVRDAPFFGYWEMKTISELRELGFDVKDTISGDATQETDVDQARRVGEGETLYQRQMAKDKTMRQVKVRTVWVRHDYNDDGIAEIINCVLVGKEILYAEEVDQIPVACIVPTLMPHKHIGLSMADAVMDLQLIKSSMLRQIFDNTYQSNNLRMGVTNKVNLDDALTSRPGGLVRVDTDLPDIQGHIMPVALPQIGTAGLQVVEYIDMMREGRTGASRAFTGVDPSKLADGTSGTAIAQLQSAASQRVELIAQVIAEGMRELFQIVHELSLTNARVPEVVRLRGKWVNIDPRQWKKRSDMTISLGLAVGNREQLMGRLMLVLQQQEKAFALGIARPENIYNALTELTKAGGFANPDKFWTNPTTNPPPPKPPDPQILLAEKALEIEGQKVRWQGMKMVQDGHVEAAKLLAGKSEFQAELNTKRDIAAAQHEAPELKKDVEVREERPAVNVQIDADGKIDALTSAVQGVLSDNAAVKAQLAQMAQAMTEAMGRMNKPRRMYKNGKVVAEVRSDD